MENIINKMRAYYPVSDKAISLFTAHLTREIIPGRTKIINAGELPRKAYFIEKGIARCYVNMDGKEMTTWFCREGDVAYGCKTLFLNQRCFETLETVGEIEAYSISTNEFRDLYRGNLELCNWKLSMEEDHFLWLCDIHFTRLEMSAPERYEWMVKNYPDICNRVNLSDIASFLGITVQSLSRIRARSK